MVYCLARGEKAADKQKWKPPIRCGYRTNALPNRPHVIDSAAMEQTRWTVPRTIIAEWRGTCAYCGGAEEIGSTIGLLQADGESIGWCCESCLLMAPRVPEPIPVAPKRQTKPKAENKPTKRKRKRKWAGTKR